MSDEAQDIKIFKRFIVLAVTIGIWTVISAVLIRDADARQVASAAGIMLLVYWISSIVQGFESGVHAKRAQIVFGIIFSGSLIALALAACYFVKGYWTRMLTFFGGVIIIAVIMRIFQSRIKSKYVKAEGSQ